MVAQILAGYYAGNDYCTEGRKLYGPEPITARVDENGDILLEWPGGYRGQVRLKRDSASGNYLPVNPEGWEARDPRNKNPKNTDLKGGCTFTDVRYEDGKLKMKGTYTYDPLPRGYTPGPHPWWMELDGPIAKGDTDSAAA